VSVFDFEFERFSLTARELKDLIYEEVELYHSEKKKEEYEKSKKEHPQGILAPKGIGKLKIVYRLILNIAKRLYGSSNNREAEEWR